MLYFACIQFDFENNFSTRSFIIIIIIIIILIYTLDG